MEAVLSIILKFVSVIMLIFSILSSLLLILTFRKPRKVSVPSLFITSAIGLITFVVLAAFAKYDPEPWVWIVMGLAGIGIGLLQARTTRLYLEESRVMSRNSVWYIVVWAALLALNQLITIITNHPPDIAMAMLIMGTAVVWGTSGDIVRRYFKMKPALAVQAPVQPPAAETTPVDPVIKAQKPVQIPSVEETSPARPDEIQNTRPVMQPGFCNKCGHKLAQGDFFCHSCGEKQ
jgi:uncharacterized protein with PQ loop repeat